MSSINFSIIKRKILGNTENQTQGCWVRRKYATFVLCTSPWFCNVYLLSGLVFLCGVAPDGLAVDLVLDDGRVVAVVDARQLTVSLRQRPGRHQAEPPPAAVVPASVSIVWPRELLVVVGGADGQRRPRRRRSRRQPTRRNIRRHRHVVSVGLYRWWHLASARLGLFLAKF